jgi:hypothetical protein
MRARLPKFVLALAFVTMPVVAPVTVLAATGGAAPAATTSVATVPHHWYDLSI